MPRGEPQKKRFLTTVLFTDIVGSTALAEELGDKGWHGVLTTHHRIVRRALKKHGGREIDTAGDGFFATFDQPSDAIACATQMIQDLAASGIRIRAGVHMGEVEMTGDDVAGIAVHVGARVMSKADAGELMVSSTVRDLMAGSEIAFTDAGFHELKGVSANMQLYAVRPEHIERSAVVQGAPQADDPAGPRRTALLVGGAALLVVAVVAAVFIFRGGGTSFVPAPNTVVRLDPASGEVVGGVRVGTFPSGLAFGTDGLWVANFDDKTVQRIDPSTGTADPALGGILANPTGIAVGGGFIWVTNGFAGQLVKIDPAQSNSAAPIPVGSGAAGVAYGEDAVWVAIQNSGTILRLDPVTGQRDEIKLPTGARPVDVVVGAGSVWVADALGGRVIRIDASSLEPQGDGIPLLKGEPARLAFGEGYVWVTSTDSDSVTRIDPATGETTSIDGVGNGPLGIAAGGGVVWVANSLDGTVVRIDPKTAKVVGTTSLAASPDSVAVTPDGVWVSIHGA